MPINNFIDTLTLLARLVTMCNLSTYDFSVNPYQFCVAVSSLVLWLSFACLAVRVSF